MKTNYAEEIGRIFDIQRFSIHDGPGIRTIVFLKGCFFRCKWCCNPESQEYGIQTMMVEGKAKTIGYDISVGEIMKEVERDRPFYQRSGGGGLTLSGGECTCQPDFAYALLYTAKERGLTTAIETTAAAEYSVMEHLLPVVDNVLLDIKHMDPFKHKAFIGRDNAIVLENAKKIAMTGANLTIRVPVIPGFNDTPKEIRAIAEFAASLKGVTRMHLLPYHRLGRDKYTGLNRTYELDDITPPSPELMMRLLQEVSHVGLRGQIGG
ncbi:MAG: glycyl-radical enzyme activating protein [Lachnospiraceae bacterium]